MFLQPNNSLHPYINLSLQLKQKLRKGYGTMFRHQLETFAILLEYGFTDSVLLKASLLHDLIEDVKDINENNIVQIDEEGDQVLILVNEVTKRQNNGLDEPKDVFLLRIMNGASLNAKILKLADRISNVASLSHVNDIDFIQKYVNETEKYILPYAKAINDKMFTELTQILLKTKKQFNLK